MRLRALEAKNSCGLPGSPNYFQNLDLHSVIIISNSFLSTGFLYKTESKNCLKGRVYPNPPPPPRVDYECNTNKTHGKNNNGTDCFLHDIPIWNIVYVFPPLCFNALRLEIELKHGQTLPLPTTPNQLPL